MIFHHSSPLSEDVLLRPAAPTGPSTVLPPRWAKKKKSHHTSKFVLGTTTERLYRHPRKHYLSLINASPVTSQILGAPCVWHISAHPLRLHAAADKEPALRHTCRLTHPFHIDNLTLCGKQDKTHSSTVVCWMLGLKGSSFLVTHSQSHTRLCFGQQPLTMSLGFLLLFLLHFLSTGIIMGSYKYTLTLTTCNKYEIRHHNFIWSWIYSYIFIHLSPFQPPGSCPLEYCLAFFHYPISFNLTD